jgi:hypothetical protein
LIVVGFLVARARWNLYWVSSDGIEDCFVVAKNARSARSVEYHMNGFDFSEITATKILQIPETVVRAYQREPHYKKRPWPWYVYGKRFLEGVGAEFRTIDGKEEMLLDEVVYDVDEYTPCGIYRRRTIGWKGIEEFNSIPELAEEIRNYDDEDIWLEPEIHLVTALGMCLIRCQQIEYYIAHSFPLGISKKQKQKYNTLNDLRKGWSKKTLGSMLQSIQEAWEIEPTVKAGLDLFLESRNLLVHGITTDERFDIRTSWGRRELLSFLNFFDLHSRIVKKAFRASYYASIEFAIRQWGAPKGVPKRIFSKDQEEEMGMFFEFFTPISEAI